MGATVIGAWKWFQAEIKEGRAYRLHVLYAVLELTLVAFTLMKWKTLRSSWPMLLLPLSFGSIWVAVHKLLRVIEGLDVESATKKRLLDQLFAVLGNVPLLALAFIVFFLSSK